MSTPRAPPPGTQPHASFLAQQNGQISQQAVQANHQQRVLSALSNALHKGMLEGGAAQVQQMLAPVLPSLMKQASDGKLTNLHIQQLQGLIRKFFPNGMPAHLKPGGDASTQQAGPSNSGAAEPSPTLPNALNAQQQAQTYAQTSQAQAQAASNPTTIQPSELHTGANSLQWKGNTVVGVKRKIPPGPYSSQPGPPAMPLSSLPASKALNPTAGKTERSPEERFQEPDPQNWPHGLQRPTLTGGLGGFNLLMSTPVMISRPHVEPEAWEQVNDTASKKESKDPTSNSKKTVGDIVSGLDPTVQVIPEVEDFLLELSDEFIDGAIHFACQMAVHRGSDTLDAKDLQLHLENNLNLRIPGFSSDETRLSLASLAPSSTTGRTLPISNASGSGAPAKLSKAQKRAQAAQAKAAAAAAMEKGDDQLGRGLRSSRLAAVRAMKGQ